MTEILKLALFSFILFVPYAFIGIAVGRYAFILQPDLSCRHSDDLLEGHTFKVAQSKYVDGQLIRLAGGRNCDCALFATWIGVFWPIGIMAVLGMKFGSFGFKSIGKPFIYSALHVGDIAAEKKIKRVAASKGQLLAAPRMSHAEIAAMESEAFGLFNEEKEGSK